MLTYNSGIYVLGNEKLDKSYDLASRIALKVIVIN